MSSNIEERIRLLLSVRRKLQALFIFGNMTQENAPEKATPSLDERIVRIQRLLDGIDGLLLLVSAEEKSLLELHLADAMKWETAIEAYRKLWPAEQSEVKKTYQLRQQGALRKIRYYVERYAETLDFSWLDDPLIDELAVQEKRPEQEMKNTIFP